MPTPSRCLDDWDSNGGETPPEVAGEIQDIDGVLRQLSDRYRDAPQDQRPDIARRMDNLAKRGSAVLKKVGAGEPRRFGRVPEKESAK